jgi:DNA-binding NtrC family response regulator
MHTIPASALPPVLRNRPRSAVVASADGHFRQRLTEILSGLRWQVREAESGAQIWVEAEQSAPEAVIVDAWLPDLDLGEFRREFHASFPEVELLSMSGATGEEGPRGPYRQELLYALRRSQDGDTASWNAAPALTSVEGSNVLASGVRSMRPVAARMSPESALRERRAAAPIDIASAGTPTARFEGGGAEANLADRLPELVGEAASMLEISRRIRLVAPRTTPVLIEGPTGSGKELVAEALHRLSNRSRKPFVAINCAAIPEALLEAELFGHTRGAFTGAVQGRVGRIEAADGGTLFLDEIGEMPLGLQSKLLRFVESGELQRVGDNETVKVDVRIVAATHQKLAQQTQQGRFRADLYYRLAVFLIRTPSLSEHASDIPLLVEHFMDLMGREAPKKRIDETAQTKLAAHDWPGNVRELEHVLERAAILAGENLTITAAEIDFGIAAN